MAMLISLNILLPIVLVVVILIVLLWILYSKSKRIHGKLSFEKSRFSLYEKHLEYLKNLRQYSEEDFKRFNKIMRAFFKEYFNKSYSLTYLELAEQFTKENKPEYAKLCKLISDIKYSGEKANQIVIKQAMDLFSKIAENK